MNTIASRDHLKSITIWENLVIVIFDEGVERVNYYIEIESE